jgi:hypothetical protein
MSFAWGGHTSKVAVPSLLTRVRERI